MTWDDFKRLTMPLAVQLGAEWDAPTWRLYHRAVEKIPLALYAAAIQAATETRTKMPSAAQLRELAEAQRQQILAAHPYTGCIECEDQRGWRTVTHPDGARVERCPCFRRHQDRLATLGVGPAPLALPAPVRDWTAVEEVG